MKVYVVLCFGLLLSFTSCEKDKNHESTYESYIVDILGCMNMQRPVDSYNYPVLPGMNTWEDFQSTSEMIQACQVPMGKLDKMSTGAVFQALWEYPFFYEITYRSNHYQEDFETVFGDNNAYNVFLKRTNASDILYDRLKIVEPVCSICKIYSRGLELFMSQQTFLNQLNYEKKQEIVSISLNHDELRQDDIEYQQDVSREITMLLIARTLYSADYEPFINGLDDKMMTFISTSLIQTFTEEEYDAFFQTIILNAHKFINY